MKPRALAMVSFMLLACGQVAAQDGQRAIGPSGGSGQDRFVAERERRDLPGKAVVADEKVGNLRDTKDAAVAQRRVLKVDPSKQEVKTSREIQARQAADARELKSLARQHASTRDAEKARTAADTAEKSAEDARRSAQAARDAAKAAKQSEAAKSSSRPSTRPGESSAPPSEASAPPAGGASSAQGLNPDPCKRPNPPPRCGQ